MEPTHDLLDADERRFWSRVTIAPNGCWEWHGGRKACGYGSFYADHRNWGAHRWAYERYVGPIPEGLQLDHLCRNPPCCNPRHLEPVTNRENTRRANIFLLTGKCHRGHDMTPDNIYVPRAHPDWMECRKCAAARAKRSADKRRGVDVTCDRCGSVVKKQNLPEHRRTMKCMGASA